MSAPSVEAARAAMLANAGLLGLEEWPCDACALGRTLAEDVIAGRDQPPFRAAAMDGYAVRAADLPGPLQRLGRSVAGAGYAAPLRAGEAVRIFTGAPVPEGADWVVPQERASLAGDRVSFSLEAHAPSFVRPQGGDFPAGAKLLAAGERLDAWKLALACAAGRASLRLARRPRLAVLTTGDELCAAGEVPRPDQIFDSAGPAVLARALAWGAAPGAMVRLPDELQASAAAIAATEADVIVAIGGASVGEHDLLRPAAKSLGAEFRVEGVNVRPGRPTWFARLPDGRRLLGLPGNPTSALVCAELFLRPLLLALQGADPTLPLLTAKLGEAMPANGPREHWLRADLRFGGDGVVRVTPAEDQDSGWTRVFARAKALVRREAGAPAASAGTLVQVLPLERL